jgi:excisionase family DNA binding protein
VDELLTSLEVARILRVSGDTVRRWRREKTGPRFIRDGGLIRYRRADLDAYLRENTVEPEEGR